MQNKQIVLVVRIVAIVTAAIALYSLAGLIIIIGWEISSYSQSDLWNEVYTWNLVGYLWFALLFILKIVSAYGLFLIRFWARKFAIAVFSADLLSRFWGIIYLYFFQQHGPPPILNNTAGVVVESFSNCPIYIMAFINLISIIILLLKPIRIVFSKKHDIQY